MIEQYIPEAISFGSAYVAGLGLDHLAVKRATVDKAPLVDAWALDETQTVSFKPTKREEIARKFNKFTPGVALALGLTASSAVAAFAPLESASIKPASIEVVVDHSGATGLSIDGSAPVLPTINKLASAFVSSHVINSEAFVASFNSVTEAKVSNVNSMTVSGYAPLEAALSNAFERTALIKNGNKSKDAAVVVITNGNTIGSSQAINAESKKQGNTPVYIVNVEGSKTTSPQDVSEFKTISKETHAKFWAANETNVNTVVSEVEKALTPEHKISQMNPDKDLLVFGSLISLLIAFKAFTSKRRGLLQRNIEGK
jgi:hypothetical protein